MVKFCARAVTKLLLIIMGGIYRLLGVDAIYRRYLHDPGEDVPGEIHRCLILGSKLFGDDSVPPILRERLDAAIALFRKRQDMVFILSGDGSKRVSNDVNAMYDYLRTQGGIPEQQLLRDDKGFTTWDSIRNLPRETDGGFVLLTSAFHMPRCVYICHRLGKKPYALNLPSDCPEIQREYRERELLALGKFLLINRFGTPDYGSFAHRLWFRLSLAVGKLLYWALRLFGKDTGQVPGKAVWKLCPYCLQYMTGELPVILVTGSGDLEQLCGKVIAMPENRGRRCVTNGARCLERFGPASALVAGCRMSGKPRAQYAVLACAPGEFWMVTEHIRSTEAAIVVGDILGTEQEIRWMRQRILCGIDFLPHAKLYLKESCRDTASLGESVPNPVCLYGDDYQGSLSPKM